MKKTTLSLTLILSIFALVASAQDSSRYDIGYLTLNKAFTQHITIRGEDLQKMPFVNLSNALRAWSFGTYTGPATLAYVVDGNPVTDVDIYPIYDIEEVTLIINAVGTAGYGNGQRELVLVTTKRGKGKDGMRVTAQTGLVNGNLMQTKTGTDLYHQYDLGVYRNLDKMSFGGSAGWQQDVEPSQDIQYEDVYRPQDLQRWRLNGWMDWRPDPENTIGLRVSYGSQRAAYGDTSDYPGSPSAFSTLGKDHLLIPHLSWEGRWARGLRNRFDAEYLYSQNEGDVAEGGMTSTGGGVVYEVTDDHSSGRTDHLLVRDRLTYEAKAGNWHIVPALDLSYQHMDERMNTIEVMRYNPGAYAFSQEEKGSLFYLTPAVDMTLARALDIGAGVMINASHTVAAGNRRLFPWVTAAVDLLHLNAASVGSSWKVFGSYARRPSLYIDDYSMGDLILNGGDESLFNLYHGLIGYYFSNGFTSAPITFAGDEPSYWTWVAGTTLATTDGRVTLQYSYERRNYSFVVQDAYVASYSSWTENFHHIDLRFKPIDSKRASWMTGLNVTLLRNKGGEYQPSSNLFADGPIGDMDSSGNSWTGGWVNRLQFGRWSAGLDLLYHFGDDHGYDGYSVPKVDPVAAPNIYAAYRWKLGAGMLEVFLQGSGLVHTRNLGLTDMWDYRRFYTIGGSWEL